MYTDFFGFKERPFNVTPDPDFIYYSDQHKEALAHMLYGVQDRKGFILITGRVGSGKTTLCRAFLRELEPTTSTALVLNTTMDSLELLKTIADDLGLDLPENAGVKKIVDAINKFVLEEYREGRNVCVIIDEAQNLSTEVLEHLRLLSNLETNKEKLLQMILVGQPELNNLLNRKQLRQLKQRITVRSFLSNLSQEETREYVLHRMNQAEPARPIQLDSKIFPRLYKASGGNPRAINLICDRLLMAAFVDETFSITCRHLRRALVDLADETENPENARVLHRLKRMDPGSWKNMDTVDFLTRTAVVAAVTFIFIITAAWLGGFFDSQTEIQVSRQLAESKLPVEKEKPQSEADPVADPVRQSTGDTEPNAESDSPANKFNVKPLSTRKGDTSLLGVVSLARYLSYVYQGDSEEINWPGKKRINYDLQLQDLIPEVLDVTMVKIG
ncbi:MAG: ExeA family protein, partial [bacterium]